MLKAPLELPEKTETEIFDFLYSIFHKDFVQNEAYLAESIYVDPHGQGMREGKEEVFWHITTRDKTKRIKKEGKFVTVKTRLLDPDRASRIHWVKPILQNHDHGDIKLFYRKETKGKKPIRLYLWAHNSDFVVIVQKLGKSTSFLVTSFYITETYKRDSYQKWYSDYVDCKRAELEGCEWF
ncbi:RlfB protein [Vibrio sp. JC009]|uniref:RlfB protein n=1 Tax=Vibrio sp. JC009 TaxID=2912314 RepID=UPI0023B15CC4|nr:RlfB protein [Vibrio sp. JC009]WED22660.1 RlfB protein [Vibrio sp. JC009]